jgi:hypothetical protein
MSRWSRVCSKKSFIQLLTPQVSQDLGRFFSGHLLTLIITSFVRFQVHILFILFGPGRGEPD